MSKSLIAIGTKSGMVLQFDSLSLKMLPYQAHNQGAVLDLWCLHQKAILSVASHDRTLFIKSNCSEFQDKSVQI